MRDVRWQWDVIHGGRIPWWIILETIDDFTDYFPCGAIRTPLIFPAKLPLKQRTLTPSFQGSNPCSPASNTPVKKFTGVNFCCKIKGLRGLGPQIILWA